MLRSVLAVAGGYLTMMLGVTTFFAFVMIVLLGGKPGDHPPVDPPAWLYVAELVSTPILAGLGGYVCAWIARRRAMRHAWVLVGISVVLGIVSTIGEAGMKPLWSSIAVVVLMCGGVPLGARARLAHERALA